jgi:hypothetical protein
LCKSEMRRRGTWVVLVGVSLLLFTQRASATICCGSAGSLVHPCSADDTPHGSAVSKALERYRYPRGLEGVRNLAAATSGAGGRPQIQVFVYPPWAQCVRTRIPSKVHGVTALVVPAKAPGISIGPGWFIVATPESALPRLTERNAEHYGAYSRVLARYGHQWMALPGVIGIEPAGCDCSRCDYSGVEVDVQRQLLESVQKVIPSSVNGMPVKVVPRD